MWIYTLFYTFLFKCGKPQKQSSRRAERVMGRISEGKQAIMMMKNTNKMNRWYEMLNGPVYCVLELSFLVALVEWKRLNVMNVCDLIVFISFFSLSPSSFARSVLFPIFAALANFESCWFTRASPRLDCARLFIMNAHFKASKSRLVTAKKAITVCKQFTSVYYRETQLQSLDDVLFFRQMEWEAKKNACMHCARSRERDFACIHCTASIDHRCEPATRRRSKLFSSCCKCKQMCTLFAMVIIFPSVWFSRDSQIWKFIFW